MRNAELLHRPASVFHQETKPGSPGPLSILLQFQVTVQYSGVAQAHSLCLAMALTQQQTGETRRHPEDEIPANTDVSRTKPKEKVSNQCRCTWASDGCHPSTFNFHAHLPKFLELDFDGVFNGRESDEMAPSWRRWASLWRHMRCDLDLPPLGPWLQKLSLEWPQNRCQPRVVYSAVQYSTVTSAMASSCKPGASP